MVLFRIVGRRSVVLTCGGLGRFYNDQVFRSLFRVVVQVKHDAFSFLEISKIKQPKNKISEEE